MKAVFRCDASPGIGTGHVTRCLTLADTLAKKGWHCHFCVSNETLETLPFLKETGYPIGLPDYQESGCDLLIVDHYGLDAQYETQARQWADKILVIDDLADRTHDCDILVDQTLGRQESDYHALVPAHCQILTGTDYAILRPQFAQIREQALKRREQRQGQVDRLLVSLGRTNIHNVTGFVLDALQAFDGKALTIDVVLGSTAQYLDNVRHNVAWLNDNSQHDVRLHLDADNMAELMSYADIAIGAGGTTSWERCCLGLPTILIEIADNQHKISQELYEADAAINLGALENLSYINIAKTLSSITTDKNLAKSLADNTSNLIDGRGCERIIPRLIQPASSDGKNRIHLRAIEHSDTNLIFAWQKQEGLRKYFRNTQPPSYETHCNWMYKIITSPLHNAYIITWNDTPVGILRLDCFNDTSSRNEYEISIYVIPQYQGKGIASCVLNVSDQLMPDSILWAEILPENEASQKLFQNAGFRYYRESWHFRDLNND